MAAVCYPLPCTGTLWSAAKLQLRGLKQGQQGTWWFLHHWWTLQFCSFKLGLAKAAGINLLPSPRITPHFSLVTVQLIWVLRLLVLKLALVTVSGELHSLSVAINLLAIYGQKGGWIQTTLVKNRDFYLFLVTLQKTLAGQGLRINNC